LLHGLGGSTSNPRGSASDSVAAGMRNLSCADGAIEPPQRHGACWRERSARGRARTRRRLYCADSSWSYPCIGFGHPFSMPRPARHIGSRSHRAAGITTLYHIPL